jgi:hypothetical protein
MEGNHEVHLLEHDQPRMGNLSEDLGVFTGTRPPTPEPCIHALTN